MLAILFIFKIILQIACSGIQSNYCLRIFFITKEGRGNILVISQSLVSHFVLYHKRGDIMPYGTNSLSQCATWLWHFVSVNQNGWWYLFYYLIKIPRNKNVIYFHKCINLYSKLYSYYESPNIKLINCEK